MNEISTRPAQGLRWSDEDDDDWNFEEHMNTYGHLTAPTVEELGPLQHSDSIDDRLERQAADAARVSLSTVELDESEVIRLPSTPTADRRSVKLDLDDDNDDWSLESHIQSFSHLVEPTAEDIGQIQGSEVVDKQAEQQIKQQVETGPAPLLSQRELEELGVFEDQPQPKYSPYFNPILGYCFEGIEPLFCWRVYANWENSKVPPAYPELTQDWKGTSRVNYYQVWRDTKVACGNGNIMPSYQYMPSGLRQEITFDDEEVAEKDQEQAQDVDLALTERSDSPTTSEESDSTAATSQPPSDDGKDAAIEDDSNVSFVDVQLNDVSSQLPGGSLLQIPMIGATSNTTIDHYDIALEIQESQEANSNTTAIDISSSDVENHGDIALEAEEYQEIMESTAVPDLDFSDSYSSSSSSSSSEIFPNTSKTDVASYVDEEELRSPIEVPEDYIEKGLGYPLLGLYTSPCHDSFASTDVALENEVFREMSLIKKIKDAHFPDLDFCSPPSTPRSDITDEVNDANEAIFYSPLRVSGKNHQHAAEHELSDFGSYSNATLAATPPPGDGNNKTKKSNKTDEGVAATITSLRQNTERHILDKAAIDTKVSTTGLGIVAAIAKLDSAFKPSSDKDAYIPLNDVEIDEELYNQDLVDFEDTLKLPEHTVSNTGALPSSVSLGSATINSSDDSTLTSLAWKAAGILGAAGLLGGIYLARRRS
ncbi:hypothetical protein K505DRAFT_364303 [Melanomma pulvis-pyrius CBS 109.77]|uniref:Uncharacterized protein n=1 Tax=Melanomma pulvis-pyrius CBS 109.77 TaxID=1314802 RepID=A0A6A6X440_9PLEO|nr:hypothetical protein K505DRAFT_364303 [Melanomma pulvis-pyrius CBS 109.77]